jgi:hypothetical protein
VRRRFDPVGRHKEAHVYIQDLKQDYLEEVQNLGFCKLEQLMQLESIFRQRSQNTSDEQPKPSYLVSSKSIRPQTALIITEPVTN